MAYTPYPESANAFSSKANSVLKDKLNTTTSLLNKVNGILDNKEHADFLSHKTLEANEKLVMAVKKASETIDSCVQNVRNIAKKLEDEEAKRQQLLKQKEDGETSE